MHFQRHKCSLHGWSAEVYHCLSTPESTALLTTPSLLSDLPFLTALWLYTINAKRLQERDIRAFGHYKQRIKPKAAWWANSWCVLSEILYFLFCPFLAKCWLKRLNGSVLGQLGMESEAPSLADNALLFPVSQNAPFHSAWPDKY